MRLDPRRVRFAASFWPRVFSRFIRFTGKRNNVQLLETALVVEGTVLKVGFLGVEFLFRSAVSEWTTVTVPYSRILTASPTSVRGYRLFFLALIGISWLVSAWWLPDQLRDMAYVSSIALTVVLAYVMIRIRPVYKIVFRSRNGVRTRIHLRITSRKLAQQFHETIQRNCRMSQQLANESTLQLEST